MIKHNISVVVGYLFLLFFCIFNLNLHSFDDVNYLKKYNSFFIYKGFLYKQSGNNLYKADVSGIQTRWIYPFKSPVPTRITSIYEDVYSSKSLVTTSNEIYFSKDYSKTFIRIAGNEKFSKGSYITTSTFSGLDDNYIAVGTSMHGLFISSNRGSLFRNLNSYLFNVYLGGGSYDIISAIEFSKQSINNIYVSAGIYGDVLLVDYNKEGIIKKIDFPFKKQIVRILDLSSENEEKLLVKTYDNYFYYYKDKTWRYKDKFFLKDKTSSDRLKRIEKAKNKGSLYLTSYTLRNNSAVDERFNYIKQMGMDAVVIDFKEDNGYLTYSSTLDMPNKVGAIRKIINVDYIVKKAKELGIYVIARFVVYKDRNLYRYNNFENALWNPTTNEPWANLIKSTDSNGDVVYNQKEFWVDIFSPKVWEYNISIAKEIQSLGVDEIQFDYIRFPSDGPVHLASSHTNKYNMKIIDALESFLIMARENIEIPISVDIYGYNGWFPTNHIGQNVGMISEYADVISPMFYPSHYANNFLLHDLYYTKRAYRIYKEGSDRSYVLSFSDNIVIRPYVQAFLIGDERKVDEETYSNYLRYQLEGVKESFSSGFSLWNASNNYYMVKGNLRRYLD